MKNSLRGRFSTQFRTYRRFLGLSQSTMARKLGIAKTTLIEWEKPEGRWQPSWEMPEEACSWTGINPLVFFIDDDFDSNHLELAERIKALDSEMKQIVEQMVLYAESKKLTTKN